MEPTGVLGPHRPRRLRWQYRMTALVIAVVAGVLAVMMVGALWVVRESAEAQNEQRALAIAQSVAADPRYADWIAASRPVADGPVQQAAETVRGRTGALYVVIADRDGVRYSHPDPAQVGQLVSTPQAPALAGRDGTSVERGTLGWSARGKVPLRAAAGAVVGTVSVGVGIAEVEAAQWRLTGVLVLIALIGLGCALIAIVWFSRRLRTATLGLEPEEMADQVRGHAAVLGAAFDGVVAVDAEGRLRVCNEAAASYLGGTITVGAPASAAGLPEAVVELLADDGPSESTLVRAGRVVQVRRLPVRRDDRDLGAVVVVRDQTDLAVMGRELEATRALTDALRAQTHEHANRLHALTGLLQLGQVAEAERYLADLTGVIAGRGEVGDPYLAGLIGGKLAQAAEAGVELRIAEDSWAPGRLAEPLEAVTVVGNLVDNAIRAAVHGRRRPAWVELALLRDGETLLVHIVDSGDGVAPGQEELIFADGWSTKVTEPGRHGVGLALARATARRHGGEVDLTAGSSGDHGAAFRARITGYQEENER